MKCSVCENPATIKIERHRAKFCEYHFIEHIHRQVERVIRHFKMFAREDKIGLAVSGGKDSMSGWKILRDMGYKVVGIHINMGFGEYSERSAEIVQNFSVKENLELSLYKIEDVLGFDFATAMNVTRKPPCSLCGSLKRYILNQIANDLSLDVLATGHNLDDESAFLLGNVLYWKEGYLRRQYPVLQPEGNMVKKVKPFVRLTDDDMRNYAHVSGIEFYSGKCPNARDVTTYVYKDVLNDLEHNFNDIKTHFYFGFLKHSHLFKEPSLDVSIHKSVHYCPVCGYKTLNEGKCLVCSIKEKVSSDLSHNQ